jgi:hypothetical protein
VTLLMASVCALSGDHGFDSGWGIINPLCQIMPCRSMFAKGRTILCTRHFYSYATKSKQQPVTRRLVVVA